VRDRYSIVVGLLFAVVIAIAALDMLGGNDEGTLGLDERARHWPLPEFAVPDAGDRRLEGDANVAQDDCETSQAPCPDSAQREPACRIDIPGAIRVCDFFERPLLISFWFSRGGDNCTRQQDVVDDVYARYRERVGFLSLDVRDDRDTVRDLIDRRGWRMPVGFDRDGAVAGLYGIGLCPTFAYVYPGGTLHDASIGELAAPALEAKLDDLLRATRAAEGR
jgi:hypothetical protein